MMVEYQRGHVLADSVRIHHGFMRSVNLWRDTQRRESIHHYIFTPLAAHTLQRILYGYAHQTQYAWTLTGPYGSGKSLFALFLTALLQQTHPAHEIAMSKLAERDTQLASWTEQNANFLPLLVVGRRASPAQCVLEAIQMHPEMARAITAGDTVEQRTLQTLAEIARSTGKPILLVFDEMGKSLEHAALHPNESDLYFLQQLAEMAPKLSLVFVGILHQAFENYAHQLERTIRREWAKIQGRFEDLPFVESTGQMLYLTARAIQLDGVPMQVRQWCARLAHGVVGNRLLPPTMGADEFIALAQDVYPLHPMAWMALPEIFRRYAQNSRSLFAFLTSHEPYGFQDFLQRHTLSLEPYPPLLGLAHLFDYLVANYQHVLYRRLHARPVMQAVQFLQEQECSEAEALVLKSLALLQWLQEGSHLRPTQEALHVAVSPWLTPQEIQQALTHLRKRSAIVLRAFNRSYHVWKGSDIDIEERLQKARAQVGSHLRMARAIEEFVSPAPIPARRHSFQTGTLRAFAVRYLDAWTLEEGDWQEVIREPDESLAGGVLLCLPENQAQEERFLEWARTGEVAERHRLLVAVPQQCVRLVDLVLELQSLRWVHDNTPELRDDPIARRELNERLLDVEQAIHEQVRRLQRSCRWFWRGQELPPARSVSRLLSDVCDQLYPCSPIVHNEIINRWILSSAGAAARRNLIQAMLTHAHEEQLGIQGYPPERSIYESLLSASGIHAPSGLGWRFCEPPAHDPLRLRAVWREMQTLIFTDPPQLINVPGLQRRLAQPPYGVTPGVFPILLCAFLQVYADECTLYREGTFLPEPGIADWEVLLRRPELFDVAGCRADGAVRRILRSLAERWGAEPKTVPLVRELVRRLRALPEHAKRTRRLSPQTLALREAVMQARSPEILLFRDIPSALQIEATDEHAQQFVDALDACLQELTQVTPLTITQARDQLLKTCGLPEGETGWNLFCQQAETLRNRTAKPHLRPLLARAVQGDTETAVESVLAYVSGRPPRLWNDVDVERFAEMVQPLGQAFMEEAAFILPETSLSASEQEQCAQLVERLREVIPTDISPRALRYALQQLIADTRQK